MAQVAIIADTHIPSRAGGIPEWVQSEIERADHVIHAGDFDSRAAYEDVVDLAPGLTAVSGNMDPKLGLQETETVTIEGVTFVVTHGTGPEFDYEDRVAGTVKRTSPGAVGVAGHTHELLDTTVDGVWLLNPGSATGASPATKASMLRLAVDDGSVEDVTTLVEGEVTDRP